MKIKEVALPKNIGWPLLIFLVFLDAFVTFTAGRGEGNPLWRPLVEYFGPHTLWFLAVFALLLFYLVTKALGWYLEQKEHCQKGEQIALTFLVIAFATYDLYIIFALPYIGYLGTKSHYAIIPVIAVPCLIYEFWLSHQKKLQEK